jgi:hypothetical protein
LIINEVRILKNRKGIKKKRVDNNISPIFLTKLSLKALPSTANTIAGNKLIVKRKTNTTTDQKEYFDLETILFEFVFVLRNIKRSRFEKSEI